MNHFHMHNACDFQFERIWVLFDVFNVFLFDCISKYCAAISKAQFIHIRINYMQNISIDTMLAFFDSFSQITSEVRRIEKITNALSGTNYV